MLYSDMIEAALSEAARKAFAMLPQGYEFQGPTAKKAILEGKLEGKLEGQVLAAAASVLEVLDARGLAISSDVRERVTGTTDVEQLRRWLRRAAVIGTVEQLFVE